MTTKTKKTNANINDFMNNMPFTFDAFKQMVDEQLGRIEQYSTEMARYEKQGTEQNTAAIHEPASLMKDSLEYSARLSGECRKTSFDNNQRATEIINSLSN